MTRPLGLVLAGLLVGCAVTPPPSLAPTPSVLAPSTSPSPSPPPVSGLWTWGLPDEPEPTPGADFGCRSGLQFKLAGDRVSAEGWGYCGAPSEVAEGTLQAEQLHLEGMAYKGAVGTPLVLELHYQPETDHMTGTWNGKPVWFARTHACASPAGLCTIEVEGTLYDEAGVAIDGPAKVTVKSENSSNPYESAVDAVKGHFRIQNMPANILLACTAEAPGRRPVTRRVTPLRGPVWTVNFGGPSTPADPDAPSYPLIPATPTPSASSSTRG